MPSSANQFEPDLSSPDWLLAGYSERASVFHFARVDRQTYFESAFLDHRIQPRPGKVRSASAAEVEKAVDGMPTCSSVWIAHTAFCASTLLASCLDVPGRTLVLREPMVLSRLAQDRRDTPGLSRDQMSVTYPRVAGLMQRSYDLEIPIIKPSNFANAVLPGLLGAASMLGHRPVIVLMSNSLQELVVSVLKKREESEKLLPAFLSALLSDSDYADTLELNAIDSYSLAQQAVLFWHCQRYALRALRSIDNVPVVAELTMAEFFDAPSGALQNLDRTLGLGLGLDAVEQAVEQRVKGSHAKNSGEAYSPEHHRREAGDVVERNRGELSEVADWAQPLLQNLPVPAMQGEGDPFGPMFGVENCSSQLR